MTMFAHGQSVWVIIPAFNEEPVIHDVVRTVYRKFPNIVVVDDGSTDRTAEEAKNAGATGLKHPLNLDQDAALQTGLAYAKLNHVDVAVTFDADGQHDANDVSAKF